MPKYVYHCLECNFVGEIVHSIGQTPLCPQCVSGSLVKDYNQPFNTSRVVEFQPKVGDLTKKYIEENREILQELKEEKKRKRDD